MRCSLVIVLLPLFLSTGCKSDESLKKRCQEAIAMVSLDVMLEEIAEKPSEGEQAIMDGVRSMSLRKCEEEGLSVAQAACFQTIRDVDSLLQVASCPAIAAKKPSWLRVPPGDLSRQMLEERDGTQ